MTIGNSEGGIEIVPCEVADERSDGELGVGQAKRKARGLRGIDLRPARQNEHPQGIVTGVAGLRQKLNSDLGDPRCRGGLNLAKKDGKAQTTPQRQSRANIKMVVLRSG